MKRKGFPAAAVLALVLLFAGCDEVFYAALSEAESTPDRPVFLLGKDDSLFGGSAKMYGWSVSGRRRDWPSGPDTTNPWHEFWNARTGPDVRYVEVDRVVYGELPEGMFHITDRGRDTGPDALRAGYVYVFHPGYHGVGSDAYFEIRAGGSGTRSVHALTEEEFLGIVRP